MSSFKHISDFFEVIFPCWPIL